MQKNVALNVVEFRVFFNGEHIEDITSFTPASLKHPTSEVNTAGVPIAMDIPNQYRLEKLEMKLAHNNGRGCDKLTTPGTNRIEVRIAKQAYDVNGVAIGLESVKYRMDAMHVSTEAGDVETGNPLGSTEVYSLSYHEREVNGVVLDVASASGTVRINGVDCRSGVEAILG